MKGGTRRWSRSASCSAATRVSAKPFSGWGGCCGGPATGQPASTRSSCRKRPTSPARDAGEERMLTAALRVYRWDKRTSSISSDRLDDDALPPLARALSVYRSSLGRARGDVRNTARTALEGLRPDRVEPVVKLLDDVSTYEWPRTAQCAERRLAVFQAAAPHYPVLEPRAARDVLSTALGASPESLQATVAALYADYPAFHELVEFPVDYGADALRADYDLAQAQALLYSATRVTVEARGDFKHILRNARL